VLLRAEDVLRELLLRAVERVLLGLHAVLTSPGWSPRVASRRPLADGADVMTFSTYKSFGGPAGGAIVSDHAG
jgi:seryl-tRNA(Sec) selenium transferase